MDTEDKVLITGELEVLGRLVDASNASLLCQLEDGAQAIYKPISGERPLWDFPDGNLASREVAAFYISEVGNFGLVPKTVLRDGPFGMGAVQRWIEVDDSKDIVAIAQVSSPELRNMALFDVVVNNADRKFGHILITTDEKIYGCDHGVSFHEENKLRTVIWQFADTSLFSAEIEQLSQLLNDLDVDYLQSLLTGAEVDALQTRIRNLLVEAKFPLPNSDWPAVPWPPY
ncbi:unannotated protein [freshwater metagenome]|uniref:Unannotated protein n=1 Tax=freshwater metagenome TaxID=449393 RepID=A0A6J6TEB6_9ZZZZ|nr:SCO1664 family protein [Actinomycetota bacterium]